MPGQSQRRCGSASFCSIMVLPLPDRRRFVSGSGLLSLSWRLGVHDRHWRQEPPGQGVPRLEPRNKLFAFHALHHDMGQGGVEVVAGSDQFVVDGTSGAAAADGVEESFQGFEITSAERGRVAG